MVRICAIGDPHGNIKKISKVPKNVDFYLVTGDLGKTDEARKMLFENIKRKKMGLKEKTISFIEALKTEYEMVLSTVNVLGFLSKNAKVYTIQGNVGDEDIEYVVSQIKNVKMIKNEVKRINGIKIGFLEYFTDESWVKEFKPSEYNKQLKYSKRVSSDVKRILNNFGKLDILVCHQPPFGYLDKVNNKFAPKSWNGKRAGSKVILDYIIKHQPKYVLCGHIHEGKGEAIIGKTKVFNLGYAGHKVIEINKSLS